MKLGVAGPGAIGCLLAARLVQAGHAVVMIDRDRERAHRITRNGVRVRSAGGEQRAAVRCLFETSGEPPADGVLICVKSFDTRAAAARLGSLVGPLTAVVSLQNGLGNAEQLAEELDAGFVVCAATAQAATWLQEGHVRHAGDGPTHVAPWTETAAAAARETVRWFASAGMAAEYAADAQAILWSKLILSAAVNPITALEDVANGEVMRRSDLRATAVRTAQEAAEVARRLGVRTVYEDPIQALERLCARTRHNVSSMRQDIQRGRRTEVDDINGAIVRHGTRLGCRVPVNAELVRRIHALEHTVRQDG